MLRVLPPPLPLLPLSTSSLRSSSSSLSKQLPALLPLLVVVVRYYFLRLLFFPFCLHAGVREAERNEGTRSVSAYSTRSFLSCTIRASSTREREKKSLLRSISRGIEKNSIFFFRNLGIFPGRTRIYDLWIVRKEELLRFLFLVIWKSSTLAVVPRMRLLRSREKEWGDSRIYFERELDNRVALVCDSNSTFFRSRDIGISES